MTITQAASQDSITGTQTTTPREDPTKVRKAARDFEALLIGNILKMAHSSEGGWLGTNDSDADSSAIEYAQESFAQSLSASGGLGLATMIARGLVEPPRS